MTLKNDNRGITLIELMLSMSLLVIIMGCVMMVMRSASQGYAQGEVQVTLQQEAQDAMNYMTDCVLAANDAEIVSDGALSGIILYDYDKTDRTNLAKSPYKVFVKHKKKLYFYSVYDSDSFNAWDAVKSGGDPDAEHLLCRNVKEFNVSYTRPVKSSDIPVVDFSLKLEAGKPLVKFTVSNSVVMRNIPASLSSVAPTATPTATPTVTPTATP